MTGLPPSELDWADLYDQLGERVFRLLHHMTGDAALAEDLTHDTFVRVHETRHHYRGDGPVAAWVFRVAANLGRDELRRGRLRRRHSAAAAPTERQAPPDGTLRLSLDRALDRLDAESRTVVLLHDVDGLNHREIAAILDIREGASRARLSRARAALRIQLSDFTRRPL